jgi:hypothetical protein
MGKVAIKSDFEVIESVKKTLEENPGITRRKLEAKVGVGYQRLKRLETEGMVSGIPAPLTHSQSATRAARSSPWGKNFYLAGTPRNGTRVKRKPVC